VLSFVTKLQSRICWRVPCAELEADSKKEDNMSATSSCEVIVAPFTKRARINVWLQLLDNCCRHSHTTVEDMELGTEEKNLPTNHIYAAEQFSVLWNGGV
jgi:hypothetical protein